MYPKAILVALLSLSLSVSAIPSRGKTTTSSADTCGTAVVQTVTVTKTAGAGAAQTSLAATPNAGKGNGGRPGQTGGQNGGQNGGQKGGQNGSQNGSTQTGNNAGNGGAAAGQQPPANNNGGGDPQKSLTLDPRNIFDAFASDGGADAAAGQEPSITSTNNFINFCLQFPDKAKTNGQQVVDGSCNQTPMGVIAAQSKMPSAKFQNPANGATIAANQDFTIQLAIRNLETGHFTNPATTFHMAPQQVNAQGIIKGHSHVVIEQLDSLGQTNPTNPVNFVFFKGLNDVAQNGVLSATVPGGLPAGTYRIATINSSSNHQPALVAVAQRGALDDMAYFTVTAGGAGGNGGNGGNQAGNQAGNQGGNRGGNQGGNQGGNRGGNRGQGGRGGGRRRQF